MNKLDLKRLIKEEIEKIIAEERPGMADSLMKELDAIATAATDLKARLQKVMDSGAIPNNPGPQPEDPRFSPDLYR